MGDTGRRRAPVRGPLVLVARPAAVLAAGDQHLLTESEQRRGAALRLPADRAAHAAAHLLVRYCAAALTGLPVAALELVQRCPSCGSAEHGRPSIAGVPDLHVSLAHTRGAVAAGADRRPIGVDVEGTTSHGVTPEVMGHLLTAAELERVRASEDPAAAFLRHWVRKECLVKVGVVTLDELSRVELDPATERSAGGMRTASRFGPLHLLDWFDRSLGVAVAAAAAEPPVVGAFPVTDLRETR